MVAGEGMKRLTIELVPSPLWYKSVYRLVKSSDWKKIREEVLQEFLYLCEVCGKPGNQCHEVWVYDDVKHIQKLSRFTLLCPACHNIKHIGRSEIVAGSGEVDMEYLVFHFCKVNRCSEKDFESVKKKAFDMFKKRSSFEWKQDLSLLKSYGIKIPSGVSLDKR